jgi:uncharacterized membrane protein AbrB (regulator of aidB expression)
VSSEELKQEIDDERKKKPPFAFWGLVVALLSILYGEFIIRVDGYLLTHSEPYMQNLPEEFIGWFLVIAGITKIIGVFTEYKVLKRFGIIMLGGMWSGLALVSFTYSFGTGFPHPSWMFAVATMAACWRIARKGDFY